MCVKRVLVVDDEERIRNGLSELLEGAGFICTAVATFHEALDILRTRPPDLLITDIRLRDYNGLHLVLIGRSRAIPAIVITGFPDDVLASAARRQGAAYLVKPVNPNTLVERARQLLANSEPCVDAHEK
jgi:two-component system response regulator YesN